MKRLMALVALTGALGVGTAATAVADPGPPKGNVTINILPLQICGSNVPILGVVLGLSSPPSAEECLNAAVAGGGEGDTTINLLPIQICGSNAPIVGVNVPLSSPPTTGRCQNGTLAGPKGKGNTTLNILPIQICGSDVPLVGLLAALAAPPSSDKCVNASTGKWEKASGGPGRGNSKPVVPVAETMLDQLIGAGSQHKEKTN